MSMQAILDYAAEPIPLHSIGSTLVTVPTGPLQRDPEERVPTQFHTNQLALAASKHRYTPTKTTGLVHVSSGTSIDKQSGPME
jgi:hypothetical protein